MMSTKKTKIYENNVVQNMKWNETIQFMYFFHISLRDKPSVMVYVVFQKKNPLWDFSITI